MACPRGVSALLLPSQAAASLLLPVLRALSTDVASHASRSTGLLGPAVRNLLEHYQISAEKVEGSGPKGYVLKGDVLSFIRNQKLEPVRITVAPPNVRPVIKMEVPSGKPGPKDNRGRVKYFDLPVSASLRQSASSLVKSKMAIPHAYLDGLCTVDDALKIFSNKKGLEKVSLTDVVVGAVVKAAVRSSATMLAGKQKAGKAMNLEVQAWKDGQLQYHTLENATRLGIKEISERLSKGASSASGNSPYKVVSLVGSRLEQITEILSSSAASWVVSVGDVMSRIDAQSKKSSKVVAVSLTYNAALISEYEASEFLENIKTSLERPVLLLLGGTGRIQNQNEDDAFSI